MILYQVLFPAQLQQGFFHLRLFFPDDAGPADHDERRIFRKAFLQVQITDPDQSCRPVPYYAIAYFSAD